MNSTVFMGAKKETGPFICHIFAKKTAQRLFWIQYNFKIVLCI